MRSRQRPGGATSPGGGDRPRGVAARLELATISGRRTAALAPAGFALAARGCHIALAKAREAGNAGHEQALRGVVHVRAHGSAAAPRRACCGRRAVDSPLGASPRRVHSSSRRRTTHAPVAPGVVLFGVQPHRLIETFSAGLQSPPTVVRGIHGGLPSAARSSFTPSAGAYAPGSRAAGCARGIPPRAPALWRRTGTNPPPIRDQGGAAKADSPSKSDSRREATFPATATGHGRIAPLPRTAALHSGAPRAPVCAGGEKEVEEFRPAPAASIKGAERGARVRGLPSHPPVCRSTPGDVATRPCSAS